MSLHKSFEDYVKTHPDYNPAGVQMVVVDNGVFKLVDAVPIEKITQAAYDLLAPPDPDTLYLITCS